MRRPWLGLVARHEGPERGGEGSGVETPGPHHSGGQARQARVPHTVCDLKHGPSVEARHFWAVLLHDFS